jgi:hypothetical protein
MLRAVGGIAHPLNTRHPEAAPTWMNCSISYGGNGTWAGSLCTCSKQRSGTTQQEELSTQIRAGSPHHRRLAISCGGRLIGLASWQGRWGQAPTCMLPPGFIINF